MEKIFSLKRRRADFSHSVLVSLISHIFMIVLVGIFYNPRAVSTREITIQDTQAFIQALNAELSQRKLQELFKRTDNLPLNSGGKVYSSKVHSDTKKDFHFLPQ